MGLFLSEEHALNYNPLTSLPPALHTARALVHLLRAPGWCNIPAVPYGQDTPATGRSGHT